MVQFNGKWISSGQQNYHWYSHLWNLYLIHCVPKYNHYKTYYLLEAIEWLKENQFSEPDEN